MGRADRLSQLMMFYSLDAEQKELMLELYFRNVPKYILTCAP
jgi:hypothetical protein